LELKHDNIQNLPEEDDSINRTILELKHVSYSKAFFDKSSINRTILELKQIKSIALLNVHKIYQSYHFGIETIFDSGISTPYESINRTILELKLASNCFPDTSYCPINRTILELKPL